MENASKALIIAGAILLSILIIAIGMYIYNSSQNSIYEAADQISTQERDAFNSQWTTYEGKQPGSNVKALIGKLISNAKTNEEEQTKLLNIAYVPDADYSDRNVAILVYSTVNTGGQADADGNKPDNINITEFNTCRKNIESRHTYFVQLRYSAETSLVDGIGIAYEEDEIDAVMDVIPNQGDERPEGAGNTEENLADA